MFQNLKPRYVKAGVVRPGEVSMRVLWLLGKIFLPSKDGADAGRKRKLEKAPASTSVCVEREGGEAGLVREGDGGGLRSGIGGRDLRVVWGPMVEVGAAGMAEMEAGRQQLAPALLRWSAI